MMQFKFSKETLNTSNVDVDPSTSLLWMASTVYPLRLKIIIRFLIATFKRGIFSALHKFHETACVSRNSRVGVSRGFITLEWVCLEGSQLSSELCLGGSLEGPDS